MEKTKCGSITYRQMEFPFVTKKNGIRRRETVDWVCLDHVNTASCDVAGAKQSVTASPKGDQYTILIRG